MTEHLPENLNDWPDGVWQLLGVDRDADLKSLRRAYTRLIRKFKPEHSPDEFQKIREAYDAVRAFAELKKQFEVSDDFVITLTDPVRDHDDDETTAPINVSSDATSDNVSPWIPATESLGELDEAWTLAREGDIAGARRRLEELHSQRPDDEDVIARLYWIRKLTPSETSEELISWLVGIVKRRELRGRAWQILLTEFSWNSRETLREDLFELAASDSQIERLVPLILIRWKRTSHMQGWKTIRNELGILRQHFLPDKSVPWIELLVAALQIVVWAETVSGNMVEVLTDEIAQFEDLHLQYPQLFDQVDELLEIRRELVWAVRYVPRSVLHVIRAELLGLDPEASDRLRDLARKWGARPEVALTQLDQFAQNSPAIFMQLLYCMSRLNDSGFYLPEGQRAVVVRMLEQFIDTVDWRDPVKARLAVLDFCVREELPLRHIVHAFADCDLPALTVESIAEFFQGDVVLHCLCEGVTAANCC